MARFDLNDTVAVITGAAGGIGSVLCREFAIAGARVVLAGRTEQSLEAVAEEVEAEEALIVPTDIRDPSSVDSLIARSVDHFGRVDVMINNAASGTHPKKPEEVSYEEWVSQIDINLTGVFNGCLAAGRQMIRQQSGKIINISSTAGTKGNPGMIHYSAAKAGVLSLTNNLAYMWAEHNICVNAVVPGLVATPAMIAYGVTPPEIDGDGNPTPRLSRAPGPEDVAALCRYLASPAADMITGEAIPVRAWNKIDRFWE